MDENNCKRAFAELKRFTTDVERALRGLCEAEEAGYISPETDRAVIYQAIDIDAWAGTREASAYDVRYRNLILSTALDAYLDTLLPSQEEN